MWATCIGCRMEYHYSHLMGFDYRHGRVINPICHGCAAHYGASHSPDRKDYYEYVRAKIHQAKRHRKTGEPAWRQMKIPEA